jgi:hypothetical protein
MTNCEVSSRKPFQMSSSIGWSASGGLDEALLGHSLGDPATRT